MGVPEIRIWTPESDYDKETILHLTSDFVRRSGLDIAVKASGKKAFADARAQDGLKRATQIFLKQALRVIFVLDRDGIQSQAQRRREPNSLINQVEKVVAEFPDRTALVFAEQELEAWLLADVLGICCHYCGEDVRLESRWCTFAHKRQRGDTTRLEEPLPGGSGPKEHLVRLSSEILQTKNPKLKKRDLDTRGYRESHSPQIAKCLHLTEVVVSRNSSLRTFLELLRFPGVAIPDQSR